MKFKYYKYQGFRLDQEGFFQRSRPLVTRNKELSRKIMRRKAIWNWTHNIYTGEHSIYICVCICLHTCTWKHMYTHTYVYMKTPAPIPTMLMTWEHNLWKKVVTFTWLKWVETVRGAWPLKARDIMNMLVTKSVCRSTSALKVLSSLLNFTMQSRSFTQTSTSHTLPPRELWEMQAQLSSFATAQSHHCPTHLNLALVHICFNMFKPLTAQQKYTFLIQVSCPSHNWKYTSSHKKRCKNASINWVTECPTWISYKLNSDI